MASIELDVEHELIAGIEIYPDYLSLLEDGVREPRALDYRIGKIASDETTVLEPAAAEIGLGEVAALEAAGEEFLSGDAAARSVEVDQSLVLVGVGIE